jgi:3-hydroxyacyl-[acyl-carrier-protein] dehydratase
MRLEYFQLIDRIVEIDLPGRKISSEAAVPAESTIFEGHFPGYPLMPGVLLIETMAQTAGWLVVAANGFKRMPFLAAVKEAKLRNFVKPNQVLKVEATLEHEGSGYAVTKAKITLNGEAVCDAAITFRVLDFPNAHMEAMMREWAARIGFPSEEVGADG